MEVRLNIGTRTSMEEQRFFDQTRARAQKRIDVPRAGPIKLANRIPDGIYSMLACRHPKPWFDLVFENVSFYAICTLPKDRFFVFRRWQSRTVRPIFEFHVVHIFYTPTNDLGEDGSGTQSEKHADLTKNSVGMGS